MLENIPASPDPDNTNDEEAQLLHPSSTTGGSTSIPPLSSLDKYGVHFRPLATLYEIECFIKFQSYFIGKPRKIKQIVNSYIFAWSNSKVFKSYELPNSNFFRKLLKLTILLEQWPYQMAWIMMVVGNFQQEQDIKPKVIENSEDM